MSHLRHTSFYVFSRCFCFLELVRYSKMATDVQRSSTVFLVGGNLIERTKLSPCIILKIIITCNLEVLYIYRYCKLNEAKNV